VNDVVAVRPEVVPVAVIVFDPPVWSIVVVLPIEPVVHWPSVAPLDPVLHEAEETLHAGIEKVIDSPAAKPVTDKDGVAVIPDPAKAEGALETDTLAVIVMVVV